MKLLVLLSGASMSALLLASATVSAAPVSLQVCTDTSCWNGNYTIADGTVVNWTNVQAKPNSDSGGNSVNDWERGAGNAINVEGWSLTMDSDPFVTNNFTVTNTTTSTQTYSFITTIGVVPAFPLGAMQGSIGFSLTDNNSNGATLATSGTSIYKGQIDGNVARTLWDPTSTFSIPFATNTWNTNFGFPTREVAPESIDTNIGIQITFSLTAGDSASFTSNFDVVPVPVPAAVWLFGSGLLGLFGVSRRKRC